MPSCAPVDRFRLQTEAPYPKFPMDLYRCLDCEHYQLLDVVDPQILFGDYIYESSISPDLDKHFFQYAVGVINLAKSKDLKLESVLDIGSNDGLLLDKFKSLGLNTYGVDPAAKVNEKARSKGHKIIDGYLLNVAEELTSKNGTVDLITANNVFSHMDEMSTTFSKLSPMLSNEGIIVFEVSYLIDTINNKVIDYIYHEHLAFHSVNPLVRFLEPQGLKIFKVQKINTKGGSIRVFACKAHSRLDVECKSLDTILEFENKFYGEIEHKIHAAFVDYVSEAKKAGEFLYNYKLKNETTAIFGASATVNVLIEIGELENKIDYIIDNSETRIGRLHPSYDIPVISPGEAMAKNVQVCLIGAWRHREAIISNNIAFFESVDIVPAFEENW